MNKYDADQIEKEFQEHCKSRTYKDLLNPKDPYDGGKENYYTKYEALSDNDVVKYEAHYKLKLPEDLKGLLLHQNGGHIEDWGLKEECLIDAISGLTIDISGDRWMFGMIPVYEWLMSRGDYEDDEELVEFQDEHKRLIILDGDGHHFIALDYRGSETCKGVVSVELECGYETEEIEESFKELFNYW